jgi:PAS domain S-box-containing protein/hemerythrin-like metal-binding protein
MNSPFVASEEDNGAHSLKGLRTRYIFVLGVVGALSLCSYLLLGMILQQQDSGAAEINLAGRQRMLSQRIELLQARFNETKSTDAGAKKLLELSSIVDLMEMTHIGLTTGDPKRGLSAPQSQALKGLYFGPDLFVDREVRNFIDVMRIFIQAAGSGAGVSKLAMGASPVSSLELLSHLDRVVGQYQKENEDKVAQIQILRNLTVIVTLGVLLFSGFLIFRPMVGRIYRNVNELMAAEERFRSITLSSRMAMIIGEGEEGRIVGWNPAAEDMFGYSSDQILGHKITKLIPQRFRKAHDNGYEKAMKTGTFADGVQIHQLTGLHKEGHEFPIELSLGSWVKSGKTYFSGIVADISERLKSQVMTDRLGRIVENATNEFFLFDAQTLKFVFTNSGGLKNLGYTSDEILKLGPADLVAGFDAAEFDAMSAPLRTGEKDVILLTEKLIKADGSTYNADVTLQFMQHETPPLFLVVVNDVSDRVTLEQSLRRSQKLEAVGQLAGGIAHDFNNLLGIILGNLEMLSRKAKLDDRNIRRVETSLKATMRAADLTKQILGFSRQDPTHSEPVIVNDVIRGMQSLIEQSAGRSVAIEFELQEGLWHSDLDQGDLEDAIVNLCVNAGHAMPNGGKLVIESRNVELSGKVDAPMGNSIEGNSITGNSPSGNSAKEYVALSISDNGEGIARDDQEKIFEPFYTTKEKGLGTGLGLAMVFGFVHRSKGDIRVYSEPGLGTTFTIYLPRVNITAGSDGEMPSTSTEITGGTEKILVVDDEVALAEVCAEYLRGAGYEVQIATSAEEALLAVQQHSDIALVFSDIVMQGGMNGFQLAVKIFRTRPGVKVLLTSGFAWEGDKAMQSSVQFVKYCIQEIVRKPYREADFLQRIRQSLDRADLIQWGDQLDAGVPSIDEDHRLLAALINLAHISVSRSESEKKILAIVSDLTFSFIYHFDREEVVLNVLNFVERDTHGTAHKLLLSRMMGYVSKYETSNDIHDAQEIVEFLKNWLFDHIKETKEIYPPLAKGRNQEIRKALEDQVN